MRENAITSGEGRRAAAAFAALEAIKSGEWDPWIAYLAGAIRVRGLVHSAESRATGQRRR